MFLAIINDTYSEIKTEIQQDSVPVGEFVSRKFKHYWNKFCPPCRIRSNPIINDVNANLETSGNATKPPIMHSKPSQNFSESLPISYDQVLNIEHRIDILESELQKIVGRIDTFIKNVTLSLNNNEEETDHERMN